MSTLKSIKRTNSPRWSFVYLSQHMSELMVPLALNGLRLGKGRWHRENCPFVPLICGGSFRVDKGEAQNSEMERRTVTGTPESVRECGHCAGELSL